jgi:AcrR family transcriptional regulator
MSLSETLQALTAPLRARKGDLTRAAILDAALAIARREGLEGLTIGALADRMRMSKSGVFAHFGSREELQRAVLGHYAARFVDTVLRPAVRRPRGLPRLQALIDNWLKLLTEEIAQGCLMIGGASEYDDRPGSTRDALVGIIRGWTAEIVTAIRQAKDEGHLDPRLDERQLAFEIYGLMLVYHQNARLLHANDSVRRARAGLQRLLEAARAAPHAVPSVSRARRVAARGKSS